MAYIAAGFDRISPSTGFENSVVTAGLGNCIAIAAIDRRQEVMRIAHYNTAMCILKNAIADGFRNLRRQLGENLEYRVGLGAVWFDAAGKRRLDDWRHQLCMASVDVFGWEPQVAKGVLSVSRMHGDFVMVGHDNEGVMPDNWNVAGTEIDYL